MTIPNDTLDTSMFKAYDIRTPAENLSWELAERLAMAEAVYIRNTLKTNTIVLCRDARLTGKRYLDIGCGVFQKYGFRVLVVPEIRSTCHFYYCCMRHPDAAGIMYGASHNPGADTGQKIVGPGMRPIAMNCGPEGGLAKIQELYQMGAALETLQAGTVAEIDYLDDYIAYSMEMAGVKPGDLDGCQILMDFLHGAAGDEFTKAFALAGATVDAIHAEADGNFPAGPPNPVVPESIASSMQKLKDGDFQFGMFFDGDGDRLDFYSADTTLLSPAFNMSILAGELHRIAAEDGRSISTPNVYACLKASPLAVKRIVANSIDCRLVRNGHSQIKQTLADNLDNGCIAAVEESAHYYMNMALNGGIYPTENTLFFALLTAKMWFRHEELYEQAFNEQHVLFREREWGYKFQDDHSRTKALDAVEAILVNSGAKAISQSEDGNDLDATLIRIGLPFTISHDQEIPQDWVQVAQRISQSEAGLARWEVVAGCESSKNAVVQQIRKVATQFSAGDKYIG